MVKFFGIVLFALAPLSPALAADLNFPPLTGRVVDEAGLLSQPAKDRITGWLAQFEQATKRQVVVVTVKSLEGDTIEDYGYRLGRAWGIGQKGRDNGVLVIVAPNEHRARIEVGYGLEGALPDVIADEILRNRMLPRFRAGDYPGGIEAGVRRDRHDGHLAVGVRSDQRLGQEGRLIARRAGRQEGPIVVVDLAGQGG